MKHILAATDGSAGGDRAVDAAAEFAKSRGVGLLILNVQEHPSQAEVEAFASAEHVGQSEVAELTARGILARALQRATRAGSVEIRTKFEIGDPTEVILQTAKQENADAIVVGKRGRGPLVGLLLGSVSQKLVSLAPCSVIVVP